MPCDKCSVNRLSPKGVSNPKIYIITDMPNDEDFDTGYPCSGASGNYLMQTLSYCNLIDKVRIISLCNCDVGHDEDINFDECVTCNLLTDLIQSNPQVIVGVGKKIIQYFLKDQFTSMKVVCGRVYNINICGFDYKFIPIYSATYVLSEISESELNDKYTTVPADYQKMINNIALFISGKLDNVEAGKKIEYCLTYKEVEDKLNSEEFSNANLLAYDIETNARPIFDEDGEIIGYSHAVKNHGFYVCLKSLDYEMPEDDRNKCFDKLLDTLKTKRVIVHNSMYERPYTLKVLNYEIPFESLEDTLVMSRLMLGGHVGAGLKNQAQTNLGYHDWETDLDKYLDACRGLLVGALNEKCNEVSKFEDIIGISTNKWCVEFKTHYENYREVCYKYYNIEETDNLLKLLFEKWVPFYKNKNRELPECLPYNIIPQRLLCKYGAMDSLATYDLYDYYREIMDRQSNEDVDLHFGYRTWLEQFYAGYVFEKNGMYWNDEFVTKERQEYNDTAVECLKNMILNPKLKDLIIDKVYDKYVGRVLSLYYPQFYECTDYRVEYDNVSGKTTVYQKKDGSDKYKRVAASKLYEIPLSKSAQKILNNKIYEIACRELKEYKTFEECKAIFNPQSSKQYDVINKALYTDDLIWSDRISELNLFFKSLKYVPGYMDAIKYSNESDIDFMMKCSQGFECIEDLRNNHNIRWGTKQKNINNILESLSNCKIDTPILKSICYNNYKVNKADTYKEDEVDESSGYEMTREKLMEIDKLYQTMLCQGDDITLIDLASQICNEKNLKKTYGDDWCNHRHEMFEGFKELAPIVSMHSPTVVKIMSHTFKMESYDDEAIIKIFNLMLLQGIDADNKDTWNDEFKWLMSFRIFKKVFKIIASYIDGKIGRQSVVVVNKVDLISGQDRVLRKRHYYDDNCRIDKATEDYIVASSFKVCTAETGRWQSGFHTIPFGSPVKKYYSSRYKGGTIFMPDYSQNEVRALAAASKCKPMIDAFLAGADIHRRNAAAIFGRPENEILDVERRFAKMATFSILYGATYDSFAENYLDGDVEKAKDIYEKFYAAFPDIRDWQQKMYKTYDETGRVPVFTGRYIVIAPDGVYNGSHASAYRKAGNYPIQGGSSDVVGSVLFEACNYIAHEHMKSKPFLFVHDSIEIDTHPDELIKMAVKMKDLLIRIPIEKFGMPVKADVALGCSLGHELEMKSIEANDNMTECTMVLEGYRNEIEDTINNWKQVYSVVDMIDCWRIATDERGEPLKDENGDKVKVHGEWDKEYISYKELYVVKRSYNKYCGSHLEKGFAKIHIKY